MTRYVIPSHSRYESIGHNTIESLIRGGVDLSAVDVFVTPAQIDRYRDALDDYGVRVLPGGNSLLEQRHVIKNTYEDGQRLVILDDDLRRIFTLDGQGTRDVDDLPRLAEEAWSVCSDVGASFWGIYPVPNPFFMSNRVRVGLWFVVGQMFGKINRRGEEYWCGAKGDYEETLTRYAHDGAVVRLENVSVDGGGYRRNAGGQQDRDRARLNNEAVNYLIARWPDLVSQRRSRDDGYAEIRLARRGPRG